MLLQKKCHVGPHVRKKSFPTYFPRFWRILLPGGTSWGKTLALHTFEEIGMKMLGVTLWDETAFLFEGNKFWLFQMKKSTMCVPPNQPILNNSSFLFKMYFHQYTSPQAKRHEPWLLSLFLLLIFFYYFIQVKHVNQVKQVNQVNQVNQANQVNQ